MFPQYFKISGEIDEQDSSFPKPSICVFLFLFLNRFKGQLYAAQEGGGSHLPFYVRPPRFHFDPWVLAQLALWYVGPWGVFIPFKATVSSR